MCSIKSVPLKVHCRLGDCAPCIAAVRRYSFIPRYCPSLDSVQVQVIFCDHLGGEVGVRVEDSIRVRGGVGVGSQDLDGLLVGVLAGGSGFGALKNP